MNFTTRLTVLIILFISTTLQAQTTTENLANESFFAKNQKFSTDGTELYSTNLDLKRHKKIGVGVSVGGASGAFGLNSELNLDAENALVIGLGAGPSYGSFNLLYKKNREGNYLSPYGKLGYSKWFRAASTTSSVGSSDILTQIFSDNDIKSGKFDTDLMITSVGVEYNQLEAEYSGVNFYGELVMMTEIKSAKMIPSGAVGIIYFY